MSHPTEEPRRVVDVPHEQAREEQHDATTYAEKITLTTHTLGLEPFVLIRAIKTAPEDPDDDGFRLKIEHNDQGASLATLYVLNLPADQNPLTAAIRAVIDANPDRPEVAEVLALFAEFVDLPMPS